MVIAVFMVMKYSQQQCEQNRPKHESGNSLPETSLGQNCFKWILD